jgi:hypothetical protein
MKTFADSLIGWELRRNILCDSLPDIPRSPSRGFG